MSYTASVPHMGTRNGHLWQSEHRTHTKPDIYVIERQPGGKAKTVPPADITDRARVHGDLLTAISYVRAMQRGYRVAR